VDIGDAYVELAQKTSPLPPRACTHVKENSTKRLLSLPYDGSNIPNMTRVMQLMIKIPTDS